MFLTRVLQCCMSIKKVKERITPDIDYKVEQALNEWFGCEYELVEE